MLVAEQQAEPDSGFPLSDLRSVSDLPPGTNLGVVMELPLELRQPNWGGGSCVHATNVMVLRHQGLYEMAAWWRKTYSGGEYDTRLASGSTPPASGTHTPTSDEQFLMWCIRTRPRRRHLLQNESLDRLRRDG